MQSKIYTFLIGILAFHSGVAQFNYYQYFDGEDTLCVPNQNDFFASICLDYLEGDNNIWQVGPPQKFFFDSAATSPNVLVTDTLNYYPSNNVSSVVFSINPNFFTPWGILAIQWYQKLDMDAGFDGGKIEFSIDNGQTWANAFNNPYVYNFYGFDENNADTLADGTFVFSGVDTTWRDIWLCYSLSWVGTNEVLVKFTFISDDIDNEMEGWMIDNLQAHVTWVHTVEEIESPEYIKVYPNPTSDLLYIDTRKIQEFHIIERMILTDVSGKVIEEWNHLPTKFFIDTRKYSNGLYSLTVITNKETVSIQVVVEHD